MWNYDANSGATRHLFSTTLVIYAYMSDEQMFFFAWAKGDG